MTRTHHTLSNRISICLTTLWLFSGVCGQDSGFLGCYRKYDGLERIRRVHQITVKNCVEACEAENKAFALLGTSECFCSNSKEERDIVENAQCLSCSSNEKEICGGFEAVAYYKTNIEGSFSVISVMSHVLN